MLPWDTICSLTASRHSCYCTVGTAGWWVEPCQTGDRRARKLYGWWR